MCTFCHGRRCSAPSVLRGRVKGEDAWVWSCYHCGVPHLGLEAVSLPLLLTSVPLPTVLSSSHGHHQQTGLVNFGTCLCAPAAVTNPARPSPHVCDSLWLGVPTRVDLGSSYFSAVLPHSPLQARQLPISQGVRPLVDPPTPTPVHMGESLRRGRVDHAFSFVSSQ